MRLAVFDFDNTLVRTADKPLTRKEIRETGWNGRDWWGSKCSLESYYFHEDVKNAFQEARNDPNTHTSLLTGRRGIIAWRIREILRKEGFSGKRIIPETNKVALQYFKDQQPNEDDALHEEYFCGDFTTEQDYPKKQDSTWTFKSFIIEKRLMNPTITEVQLWDDRIDHFPLFCQLAQSLLVQWNNLQSVTIYQIQILPNSECPNIIKHYYNNTRGN